MASAGREIAVPDTAGKRLNEMDRLGDLAHFPAIVRAGAAANIAVTVLVTWWVSMHFVGPLDLLAWLLLVLAVNLLPVFLLRLTMNAATPMPTLQRMDFVHDQHKFSDWVYVAASANMAFWVVVSWSVSRGWPERWPVVLVALVGALHTFWPVVLPGWRSAKDQA